MTSIQKLSILSLIDGVSEYSYSDCDEVKTALADMLDMRSANRLTKEQKNYLEWAIDIAIEYKHLDKKELLTVMKMISETAYKDCKNGIGERKVGYYDKWYRYSRSDDGWAYDKGQKWASSHLYKLPEVTIIELDPKNIM